ncbi:MULTISPECIES: type II secretion system F family protein [Limibacillus]|jgi:tight adherence protein C|uniref:Tight adherence protein C n=1 Tax=Limibacillus halophilus TaxID=1579333 RepID=A0A839STX0_9PROT|nr:type II secretion system F family protein [Limibacillus halophilus]MBB3066287.1 tight adherence protein C [Limibacillus halophilus]
MPDFLANLLVLAEANAPIVVGGLVFLVAGLLFFGLTAVAGGEGGFARRLSQKPTDREEISANRKDKIAKVLSKVGESLPQDMTDLSRVRRQLVLAGYYSARAVPIFYAVRAVIAITLPVLFSLVFPLVTREFTVSTAVGGAAVLGIVGLYLPVMFLKQKIGARQQQARDGFPDALDLLVVCVEAGLSLDQAIERISREIGRSYPVLGENFRMMASELRAGQSRTEALRNVAERMGVDEVKAFVVLLIQSEELGTSIAETLRVYTDEMRDKRVTRAEEKAQALPAKLSVPLVLFIFPVLMIVILSPVIIRMMKVM